MKKHELYFVTSNPGKFDEVERYFAQNEPGIELKQAKIDLPEPQSLDQEFIARSKATAAWELLKQPLIIDDAGIYFDAYKDFPGTMTKFVHCGIGFEGVFALTATNNKAQMRITIAYADEAGELHTFIDACPGQIVRPKDLNYEPGMPWSTIFVPDGSEKTYAELRGTSEEERYLYRIRALKKFLSFYKQREKKTSSSAQPEAC